MKKQSKFLNNKLIILIFGLLSIIFFANIIFTRRLPHGDDQLIAGYIFKFFGRESILRDGQIPLWNPYIFGGLPFVDVLGHGDIFYWTQWLRLILPINTVMGLVFVVQVAIAGIFTYLFLVSLGFKREIAIFGGLAYMFTGSIVSMTYAGHDAKVGVASFLPFVLYLINTGINRDDFKPFIICSLGIALPLLSPHVQMAYYLLILAFLFTVFRLFFVAKEKGYSKAGKYFGFFWITVALGFLIASIQLLPGISYLEHSPRAGVGRGYEFATSWSLPPLEIFDWITPHFSGLLQNYWGLNYFKQHTEYFSVIILFFALVGIFLAFKRREVKFFTLYIIFGLLMALGGHTPFYILPYHLLPLISKFRGPAMIFYTVSFSFVVLAAYGLRELLGELKDKKLRKKFYYIAGFFLLFLAVFLLFSLNKEEFLNTIKGLVSGSLIAEYGKEGFGKLNMLVKNYSNFISGLGIALLFTIIAFSLISLYFKRKINESWTVGLLSLFLILDLWIIGKRFVKTEEPFEIYYQKDEVVRFLQRDQSLFRVFPLYYREDNYLMLHHIQSLGGYHGNQLGRYQEFIGAPHTIMFRDFKNLFYPNFLNLLNAKYIIAPILPEDVSPYTPEVRELILRLKSFLSSPSFREVFKGRREPISIYKNEKVLPRAFIVPQYEVIKEKEEILERLKSEEFDPSKKVIIEKEPPFAFVPDTLLNWEVNIIEYKPNLIRLNARLDKNGFLVLSENWYPFWKVRVNGKKEEIYRANYVLRAVMLSPGFHKIEFYFDSPYFTAGMWTTILTIAFVLGYLGIERLRRKKIDK